MFEGGALDMSISKPIAAVLLSAALNTVPSAEAEPISPSPSWRAAMPDGPVAGTKITPDYAVLVARDAFFWAWPLINVYNRRLTFEPIKECSLMGGIVPVAPHNRLTMLTRLHLAEGTHSSLPEPGRRLWQRHPRLRQIGGGYSGAGLRQSLLGLPDRGHS